MIASYNVITNLKPILFQIIFIQINSSNMPLNEDYREDILACLNAPEFCDVKLVASDGGEILANKTILSMRSQYFHSMFSTNNNFVESKEGRVEMAFNKTVLDNVVTYLYSGQMVYEDMALRDLLGLMELLNFMNLSMEFSVVEKFVTNHTRDGLFALSDCLRSLNEPSMVGLKTVEESILAYLGENFDKLWEMAEVKTLSEPIIIQLLQEKKEDIRFTIHRFRTLLTWLSANSMDTEIRDAVLETVDFHHFTSKELSTVVRDSGFYSSDDIIDRMQQLYVIQEKELELREFKIFKIKKENEILESMNEYNRPSSEYESSEYEYDPFSQ